MEVAMPSQFHLRESFFVRWQCLCNSICERVSSFDFSTQSEFAFEGFVFLLGFEVMGSCFLLLLLSALLVISVLLLLSPPARSDSTPANVSHHDQQALLGLKRGITFDPNNSLANWTPSLPFCNWTGITCSFPLQRVIELNVSYMGLVGTVSPLVGNLSALESLDMSNNLIHGHIPPQLGQLSNAKELLLHRNDLEGSIPASLGSCHRLVMLALSFNRLQGNVPVELGHLTGLEALHLGTNSLTGKEEKGCLEKLILNIS